MLLRRSLGGSFNHPSEYICESKLVQWVLSSIWATECSLAPHCHLRPKHTSRAGRKYLRMVVTCFLEPINYVMSCHWVSSHCKPRSAPFFDLSEFGKLKSINHHNRCSYSTTSPLPFPYNDRTRIVRTRQIGRRLSPIALSFSCEVEFTTNRT